MATTSDVSVFLSDNEVDEATLTAATNALKAEGVSVEVNDVDPIVELGTIEGADSSILETFKTGDCRGRNYDTASPAASTSFINVATSFTNVTTSS